MQFGPFEDHVEGLSIGRIKAYSINRAVQKYFSEQFGLLRWFARKV
jgi:hypothetical protein